MYVPTQAASEDIWDTKYRLKNQKGEAIDTDIDDSYRRVAKFLSKDEVKAEHWFTEFLWAMRNGAIPAGRIMSNAGAEKYKPATSLINCVVSQKLTDSIEGIFDGLSKAAISLKAGCGIGYEGSTIRPKGAVVNGAGATTTGSLPFLEVYDKMCSTIASAGGRRGAQMLTFDMKHPDLLDLIRIKRETGRFTQFNISLLITDEF
ncbi:MAG: ribonucleoside-diphosphate reductase, partial [Methylococcales bacterium]|nr:ribonucleoside-diphosphate reductase [Methylococcales bacterium]